jgi:chorismate mutase
MGLNPELNKLRTNLEQVNSKLLELINQRQETVDQIQTIKGAANSNRIWVPEREFSLFQEFNKANPKDSKLDLIYSLLIEKQAMVSGNYPEWSTGEHLDGACQNSNEMINPILLFIRNRSEYQKLKLSKNYNLILKGLFKDEI